MVNKLSSRLAGLLVVMLVAAVAVTACTPGAGTSITDLSGKRVAVLVTIGFEPTETSVPMEYLRERGADVVVVSYGRGPVTSNDGRELNAELGISDVS